MKNIPVLVALIFLLPIILNGCKSPDLITNTGIAVYASESGKLVSGNEIDRRIFNVWRQYSGRDPYSDFYNGYLEVFNIFISDYEIYNKETGKGHRGITEIPTLNMYLLYKDPYDCELIPALEHEYGHIIAYEEGDHTADPEHMNNNIWQAVQDAKEEITTECMS